MKKQFVTALILGTGAALVGHATAEPAKPAAYDGTWSVCFVTESGSCDAAYHYTIAVEDGRVRPLAVAEDAPTSVSGGVGRDGSVTLSVQRSIAQAQAPARLQASSGRRTARRGTLRAQAS